MQMMKNIIKYSQQEESETSVKNIFIKNFNIRKIKMKTRILYYGLLTVIFLVAFSGCNIMKKKTAETGTAGRVLITSDSNLPDNTDEQILNDNADYNAQGINNRNTGYINNVNTEDNMNIPSMQYASDNSNTGDEEILNDNPDSEEDVDNIETFENSLSDDGSFINVTQEEIDPDNNTSLELANVDEDIFPSTIWVPNSNYVSADWNPYSNGRWVWSSYGWYWRTNYRWHATYHYGRWWYSHRYGWVWSPGRRWAPAWVVWGHHRNYEGWHPISPRVHFHGTVVISPVMPHYQQNGWIIVKKNDFTSTVNSTTIIPYTKTKDILKNSTISVTLKQDGKRLYNEGPDVNLKKNEINKKNNEQNSVNQVLTTSKSDNKNNTNVKITKTKQNNTNVVNSTVEKNNVNKKNTNVITVPNNTKKETQKKGTENKGNVNVNTSPVKKQNNAVNTNKNSSVESKTTVKENTKVTTTPVNKQNNSSVNTNKSNTNENKNTVKETPKKKTETQPVNVEKSRNNNNNSTSNNTFNTTKTEYTPKVKESPRVIETPKVKESPRVTETPKVRESPRVTETPKVRESPKVTETPKVSPQQKNGNKK